MENKNHHSDTVHYILTFFSVIALIGCFGTHFITGRTALLQIDSLAGSIVIGLILWSYLLWFIYDYKCHNDISVPEAAAHNLKLNPAAYCIYLFTLVFVMIPFLFTLFTD